MADTAPPSVDDPLPVIISRRHLTYLFAFMWAMGAATGYVFARLLIRVLP